MTVIGDAMKKAGLEAPEPVESGEKHKLAFTQKVACMKSSIQNIVRLTGKYEKVLGDEQEEMDTLSALRSHFIDMTVPQGTNISTIKRDYPQARFHYVMSAMYSIGITETTSPQGGLIRLYDRERCLCDIIRDKKNVDMQLYTQALKDYFRSGSDCRKLLKYGKKFGIEEQIRTYMEVLS